MIIFPAECPRLLGDGLLSATVQSATESPGINPGEQSHLWGLKKPNNSQFHAVIFTVVAAAHVWYHIFSFLISLCCFF